MPFSGNILTFFMRSFFILWVYMHCFTTEHLSLHRPHVDFRLSSALFEGPMCTDSFRQPPKSIHGINFMSHIFQASVATNKHTFLCTSLGIWVCCSDLVMMRMTAGHRQAALYRSCWDFGFTRRDLWF